MFYAHFAKLFKSIPEKCMLINYNIKYLPIVAGTYTFYNRYRKSFVPKNVVKR